MNSLKCLILSLLTRLYRAFQTCMESAARRTLVYYPPFDDQDELLHHFYAARYFLPAEPGTRVLFLVTRQIKDAADQMLSAPRPEYLGECTWGDEGGLSFLVVDEDLSLTGVLCRYLPRHIFLWSSLPETIALRLVLAMEVAVNVDRHTIWGCYNYPDYHYRLQSAPELEAQRAAARDTFTDKVSRLPQLGKSYVFGTGPSIGQAFKHDFSDGYRIVCNTMIKNKKLMRHIKPHFLVAGDAIYHFGISRYACQFRKDLDEFLNEHDCLFLIPERYYPNLILHHPGLAQRTVPVPYTAECVNLSLKERFETRSVHNILNQLLLPLASSLCDNIFLLGFDGRNSRDTHFWASLGSVNYEDLKVYHQQAHPGFFQGMDYQQYADIQAELAEEIMSRGESMGKTYQCLNESGNAALRKRFVGLTPISDVTSSRGSR